MEIKKQLEIYKIALKDYRKGLISIYRVKKFLYNLFNIKEEINPFYINSYELTRYGFCHYFNNKTITYICTLSILNSLRPDHELAYWFPVGDKKSRIKLLKKAIKICEQKLNQ